MTRRINVRAWAGEEDITMDYEQARYGGEGKSRPEDAIPLLMDSEALHEILCEHDVSDNYTVTFSNVDQPKFVHAVHELREV